MAFLNVKISVPSQAVSDLSAVITSGEDGIIVQKIRDLLNGISGGAVDASIVAASYTDANEPTVTGTATKSVTVNLL